jgi:hypothetical protein
MLVNLEIFRLSPLNMLIDVKCVYVRSQRIRTSVVVYSVIRKRESEKTTTFLSEAPASKHAPGNRDEIRFSAPFVPK